MLIAESKSCRDFLGVDCIHFYVENVDRWRKWFEDCLGFQTVGTVRDHAHTEILQHGTIQIKLSAPLRSSSPVAKFLQHHPAGVGEIAFRIKPDSSQGFVSESSRESVQLWGDVTHHFVTSDSSLALGNDRSFQHSCGLSTGLSTGLSAGNSTKNPTGISTENSTEPLFTHIDHLVLNVPVGEMWKAAHWCEQHMGLQIGDRFHIQTERSALKSIVMENSDRTIQIPINEPSTPNSQIQEFLDRNRGAGIQHIALHTHDIFRTVAILKSRGVKFLETSPPILVDVQNHETGQALLQIFTQPIFDQPTFFFEIIQRQNLAQGFGEGNFQALFEAIEREQIERKSL
ncbi:VOC family protein [Tumidithrix elongata RA019]|uniref:VOC family protein n=1 Tax=Tumidithrix elongata BACA0141 TaxID=2716417 RepID=A0AAW9PVK1_9CYAN|nr:VOC family protein [Tumidithrix elongata RA019]